MSYAEMESISSLNLSWLSVTCSVNRMYWKWYFGISNARPLEVLRPPPETFETLVLRASTQGAPLLTPDVRLWKTSHMENVQTLVRSSSWGPSLSADIHANEFSWISNPFKSSDYRSPKIIPKSVVRHGNRLSSVLLLHLSFPCHPSSTFFINLLSFRNPILSLTLFLTLFYSSFSGLAISIWKLGWMYIKTIAIYERKICT